MTVKLSSLRVTAEMDVSNYTRAMAQKVAADGQGAASAKAVGIALGQMDASVKATGDSTAKLSRQLIEGYAGAAKFEKVIRDVGRAVDAGMSLDRAAIQLDSVYRKFGLVADATVLAHHGFVSIVPVIEQLNEHYAEQNMLLQQQSEAASRAAAAAKAQAELEARVKSYVAAVDPLATAQDRYNASIAEAEDLYTSGEISLERYRLGLTKAQTALDAVAESTRRAAAAQAQASQNWFNSTLGVRDTFSTGDRGADMEAAIREAQREAAALEKARQEAEAFNRALLGIRDSFSARDGAADMEAALRDAEAQWRQMQALAQKEQDAINALLGVRTSFSRRDGAADMEAALRDAEAQVKRAEAVAQQAQAEMNALLGVRTDFATDQRARDIEAWTQELDRYLAGLVRVRDEEERIARERRVSSQAEINGLLGVRAPISDAAYAAQAQGYEELGRSIDQLRARYDPLYAAEMKHADAVEQINRLYAMGEVDTTRYADILRRANTVHDQTIRSLRDGSAAVGLNAHQWQNLGFQVNDVVTMLLSGASPFQAMATQGGQVIQILGMGEGGIAGSLKGIGATALGLLTPFNLVGAAVAALGIAGVASYVSWINAQAEVERSLLGIGRASGATAAQINAIAEASAGAGRVSIAVAREMASTFAATGRISPDIFGDAIASAKDFAKVLNTDAPAAAQKLAEALADPARGAEQLNQTLGAFSAATLQRIQSLEAQNRYTEAQRLIIDGVQSATKGAEQATTSWSRSWDALAQSISNVWTRFGRTIDRAVGSGTIGEQRAALQREIEQLEAQREAQQKVLGQLRGSFVYSFRAPDAEAALDDIDEKLRDLRAKAQGFADDLAKAAAEAAKVRMNLDSIKAMGEIKIVMPEIDMRRVLGDRAALVGAVSEDPVMLKALGLTQHDVDLAAARAREMRDAYMTTQEAAVKQAELANRAITARSPAERAAIAAEQKKLELANAALSPAEKQVQIQLAYANALKEGNYALSEQERSRVRAIRDQVGATQAEIDGIGKTAQQAELLRLNWQTYADLRREAEQNHTAFDAAQFERLKKENEELARRNQMLREAQLYDDLAFERSQLGRSSIDQQVATRLRSAGQPVDMNSQAAAAIRYNETMKQAQSITSDFASSFVTDLAHGVKVLDALSNALTRLADQLIKMATDQLVAQAFGGILGGGGGFGFGGGGGRIDISGGASSIGLFHTGGIVGAEAPAFRLDNPALYGNAPRYHSGRDPFGLLAGERRAIVKDTEGIFTIPQMQALGARMGDTIAPVFSPTFMLGGGDGQTAAQRWDEFLPLLRDWWKVTRRDVINVVREARAARVRGV